MSSLIAKYWPSPRRTSGCGTGPNLTNAGHCVVERGLTVNKSNNRHGATRWSGCGPKEEAPERRGDGEMQWMYWH